MKTVSQELADKIAQLRANRSELVARQIADLAKLDGRIEGLIEAQTIAQRQEKAS